MIIARGSHRTGDKTNEVLVLGLSRTNIDRLVKGDPIQITRATHGDGVPEGWEIVITFGVTEMDMARDFKSAGVIGPDTKVTIDARL